MPSLPELQRRFAAALFAPDAAGQALPGEWFAGMRAPADSVRVHRNTVLSGYANALRLAFPALDRLVGEGYFDRLALEFVRQHPPAVPQLDLLGGPFAEWLAQRDDPALPAYAVVLARFEWQFDALARSSAAQPGLGAALALEGGLRLDLDATLRLHRDTWCIDAIREQLLAGDTGRLEAAVADRRPVTLALWRSADGVHVRALSPAPAAFIAAALAGASTDGAIAAASAQVPGIDGAALMDLLATEVLSAGYARIGSA